jgi:oligopeptide/dipeptide ABC transporter ATP-binding protein
LVPIVGLPPNLINMPQSCAFLPRCAYHIEKCKKEPWPALRSVGNNHYTACYLDIQEK